MYFIYYFKQVCFKKKDLFLNLPIEIITEILTYFDLPYKIKQINFLTKEKMYLEWKIKSYTFINCLLINKDFYKLTNNPYFWHFKSKNIENNKTVKYKDIFLEYQ